MVPAQGDGVTVMESVFLQIAAYEREIGSLQAELMKEIEHLEEKKDEAVKAAANCSQEQFQSLQDQFMSESVLYHTRALHANFHCNDLNILFKHNPPNYYDYISSV